MIIIYGSAKFLNQFNQTLIDAVEEYGFKHDYGLHPKTGKAMTKDDFYNLAKEQNWSDIQIYNNLNIK